MSAATIPAMALGTLLGRWVNGRIDPSRFHRLIYAALLALGALVFFT